MAAAARPATPAPALPAAPAPTPSAPPHPAPPAALAARSFPAASVRPTIPPPPSAAPAQRGTGLPSAAQQLVERAIRTAPHAPVQRRSTVRLGFADASVIDLRPDDPIAKALHTVADALIGRERV
jgi:hypothetical protein